MVDPRKHRPYRQPQQNRSVYPLRYVTVPSLSRAPTTSSDWVYQQQILHREQLGTPIHVAINTNSTVVPYNIVSDDFDSTQSRLSSLELPMSHLPSSNNELQNHFTISNCSPPRPPQRPMSREQGIWLSDILQEAIDISNTICTSDISNNHEPASDN
jgi:hypothetical protein